MHTPSDLVEFDDAIRRLTNEAPEARPFLCEGSPLDCKVFLVGINPGKSSGFWPRWAATTGCDKRGWIADYLATNGRYSPTRQRIERLFAALSPIPCLETNIFPHPSPRESALAASGRDTRVFDYLLERIQPAVVFVHGQSAVKHLSHLAKADLPLGRFTTLRYRGVTFDALAGYHLSYQWSYAKVQEMGETLAGRYRVLSMTPNNDLQPAGETLSRRG